MKYDEEWIRSEGTQQHLKRLVAQREQALLDLIGTARSSTDAHVAAKAGVHWALDNLIVELTNARS